MSDYASAAERARRAFAALSRIEDAISRAPHERSLLINHASKLKYARQMQEQLERVAAVRHVELCNYRIMPMMNGRYLLPAVSKSLLNYQYVFSQVHDALTNGPKSKAQIGREAWQASQMELGYTYSGSLGVVLMAPSERSFFDGNLDQSIDAVYQVLAIDDEHDVRDVAKVLGEAVIKRVHDWTQANVEGGFDLDIRWSRSDGRQLGRVVEREEMAKIVGLIARTSDEKISDGTFDGLLVGVDLKAGSFHFVVPGGEDLRGGLSGQFDHGGSVEVGLRYRATVRTYSKVTYSTGREERRLELLNLERVTEPSP